MKLIIFFIPLLMLVITPANAAEWKATQGDVITVESTISGEKVSLRCFDKNWPVKRSADGHWRGWVGVDLKKKPGSYKLIWSASGKTESHDSLTVDKGTFRISHIEVPKKMASGFDKPTLKRIRAEKKELLATFVEPVDADLAIHMTGKPVQGIESTPFGAQRYVNGAARSPHSGIDIAAPAGTAIITPLAGKVLMVSHMYFNGKTVAIGHGNGLVSVYSHMQSTAVKKGEWIKTHQKIGEVGTTGRSTGPHLHWGVRFQNARVNPESLL